MKFRLPTLIGIVLVFGYFIMESFKMPSSQDPTQVVMVGKDTLGRDWGAMAEQREREKKQLLEGNNSEEGNIGSPVSIGVESNAGTKKTSSQYGEDVPNKSEDPDQKSKLNSSDYSSVQAADGREIITGYSPDQNENNDNYETRHQKELTKREGRTPP